MATNQDKIATIGDIKTLLATAKEKGVTIKKSDGTEWAVPSSFTDDSLCPTYNQINGTVLPSYADNASDKLSSTDGVVIGNFNGSATAYTDTQLVRLGDITLKATSLDSSSFSLTTNSKVETSCAVSATCEYTYDVNVSSYSYEDTDVSTSTSTVTGTSGTWSGTDSSTSNVLSNQGQNMSFTNTREYTISCSVTLKGETMSDSLTLTQPKREQGKFISSSSTEDSHALEAEVETTSFDCDGGTANVTWYHVYGSATSTTYEDTCGVQYTETSGEGRQRDNIGKEAYAIPRITCDPMTGYTTTSHTLTSSYTYTDSAGQSQTIDGSVDVSQKCWSCEMAYKYTLVDGTIKSGTCRSNLLSFNSIQGEYYNKAQKIELFNCINGFASDSSYFGGDKITSITMTDSVSAITSSFATGAKELTTVTLSSNLKSIPFWAFRNCDSLTNVNFIPEGVETIGENAFGWCQNVTSATIPSSVTSIGNYAFTSCIKLQDIYMSSPTPPTIGDDSFNLLANNYIIHVPCEYEEAYKTASDNWAAIASHVVGDCSCVSCFEVNTNNLPPSGNTSGFTCATVTLTGTASICSAYTSSTVMPSTIYVADEYSSWITSAWTSSIYKGVAVQVYCTQNDTSETRYATLILSGDSCTEGIEISLTQEADCHKCFTLQEIEGQNVTLSGNTYTFQGDGTQSESKSVVRIKKGLTGDCSTIPQYNALELQDLGYGTDWLTIDTFNEASGDYVITSGIISSNPTNNERTMRLHYYTSGSSESCPMDVVIKQKSSSVTCNCEESNYFSWVTYCSNTGLTDSIAVITLTSNTSSSCSAITYDGATVDADFVTVTSVSEVGRGSSTPSFIVYGTVDENTSSSPRTYNVTFTSSTQPCTYTASVRQNGQVASSCKNVSIYACANSKSYVNIISDTEIRIGKQGQSGWSFVALKATNTGSTLGQGTDITYRMDFGSNAPWLKYIQRNNNGPFGFADNAQIVFFGCSTENDSGVERTAIMTVTYTDASGVCEKNIKITQAAVEEVPFQITGATVIKLCTEDRLIYYTIDYVGTAPSTATCTVTSIEDCADQFGVTESGVSVNQNVHTISIHGGVSSACTDQQLIVKPDEGVNASATSYTVNFNSAWTECSGTISLDSYACSPPITSGNTTQAKFDLTLSYSGPTDIDTNGLTISFQYYMNMTIEKGDGSMDCPICAAIDLGKPLCNFRMTLNSLQLASLINKGSLSYSELMTVVNVSPSTCSYSFGSQYGVSASSSDESRIKIGDGFITPPLG